MTRALYRMRYAYWLHRIGGLSWWQALTYPVGDRGDPREDAKYENYLAATEG